MGKEYFSNRVSVRNYEKKRIPESLLDSILERAMRAPTCGNMQLYSVIVTREPERLERLAKEHFNQPAATGADEGAASNPETKIDDTFIKALKFCVTSNQASVSMIQRRFPIGYMKACKIIDWMENMNYITQSEGSKPRKVLLSREEFIRVYGDVDD